MIPVLTSIQADALLDELCRTLGFCPPLEALETLTRQPPPDIEAFTDAVIRADALAPECDISLRLYRQVRAIVTAHFHQAEDARQRVSSYQSDSVDSHSNRIRH
ncbi:hypothetical protein SAMN02745166_02371 [Prosthecobacter debontii]|uniref:Uncharacterized protein n=1 Tax=Prosthecobacter debontii TaxID=48467 RepID=A0A1T4Y3X2_9BACT|nr:hypothetical protein SAMN02745166_02371 [Prosthecobacter debontii]